MGRQGALQRSGHNRRFFFVPQTVLALRGSYGVAKDWGYEMFAAAVALPEVRIPSVFKVKMKPTLKQTLAKSTI